MFVHWFFALRKKTYRRLIEVAVSVSIVGYIVALFTNRELGFIRDLVIPLLLATVLLLLEVVMHIDHSLGQGKVAIRRYDSARDFYGELQSKIRTATKSVRTSYLRQPPPRTLGDSAERYFESCRSWAATKPQDRTFRRVVVQPVDKDTFRWLRDEVQFTTEQQDKHGRSNYAVKVVDWKLTDPYVASIAIVDEEYVFVAFAGDDSLIGFSIHDRELATTCFGRYYDWLWRHATDGSVYFADRGANTGE